MASYNLQRFFKWRKHGVYHYLNSYTPQTFLGWYFIIGTPLAICVFLLAFIPTPNLLWLAFIALLTFFYLFVNPTTKKLVGLRYIPFGKSFIIAFCWTFLFLLFSCYNPLLALKQNHWYWLVVYLQVWIACVLFDIRDMTSDSGQLITFAIAFGKKGVFVLWVLSNIAIAIIGLTQMKVNSMYAVLILVFIWLIQSLAFRSKIHPLWFTFWIDGSLVGYAFYNYLMLTR